MRALSPSISPSSAENVGTSTESLFVIAFIIIVLFVTAIGAAILLRRRPTPYIIGPNAEPTS